MAEETFSYGDLAEIHKSVQSNPFFQGKSLAEFSALMNEATQSHAYDQGLNDTMVKRVSTSLDKFLQPLSGAMGDLTGDITKGLGMPQFEQQGRGIGESLPRMLGEGALIAGGLATLPASIPAGAAMAGAGALGMGASTYTETGSPTAGVISGLSGLAFPGAARLGEAAVKPIIKRAFYEDVAGSIAPITSRNGIAQFVEPAIEATGRNVGMAINNEVATQLISKTTTGEFENPLTPEGMFSRIGSQLPFAIIDAAAIARGPQKEAGQPGRGEFRSRAEYDFARDHAKVIYEAKKNEAIKMAAELEQQQAVTSTLKNPTFPDLAPDIQDVPSTVSGIASTVDSSSLVEFDLLSKATKDIRETGSFNPNTIPIEYRVSISKQLINDGIIDETGKLLAQPGQTDDQLIADIKKRSIQFELPNTLEELQHVLETAPVGSKLASLVETKIKGLTEEVNFEGFKSIDPIDQLRQQLIERNGPAVLKTLIEMPVEQKLKQVQDLSEFLDDIMKEAVVRRTPKTNQLIKDTEGNTEFNAGTPKPFESSRKALIKNYVNDLLGMGEAPEIVMDRQYKAYTEKIAQNVEKIQQLKDEAEQLKISPLPEERAVEAKRMARLSELSEPELKTLTSVLQSDLWFDGVKGGSHVEHDLTSTIMSAAVAYHDKVADAVEMRAKYKGAVTDLSEEQANLYVMRNYINKAAIQRLNEYRKTFREQSESQKPKSYAESDPQLREDPRSPTEILNAYEQQIAYLETQSNEQQARLKVIEESTKSLPDTDANGWAYEIYTDKLTGAKSIPRPIGFERNVEEQVARLNKALNLVRQGVLGYRIVEKGPFKGQEGLHSTMPWEQVAKALNYAQGDESSLRKWINNEFLPKLKGRLRNQLPGVTDPKLGTQFRLSGAQAEVVSKANLPPHVLDESKNPLASMLGAEAWFSTWMTSRGMNKAQVETFVPLAMKIAASFQDVGYTRVGTLLTEGLAGISFKPLIGLRNASVWMSKTIGDAPAEVQVYLKFRTFGHEMWHTMVNARLKGIFIDEKGRDLPIVQQIDNAMKWSLVLSDDARAEINGRYSNILVPKDLRSSQELETYDKIGQLYASKDPSEFLADFVGQMVLGHVSPDRAALMRPFDTELMFDGPEIQNFAKGAYVPVYEMTKMLEEYFNDYGRREVGTVMTEVANSVKSSLTSLKQVDNAVGALNLLASNDLGGYMDMLKRESNAGEATYETLAHVYRNALPDNIQMRMGSFKDALDAAKNFVGVGATAKAWAKQNGVQPGWLWRMVGPSAQLSAVFPQLQPVFDLVRSYRSEANLFAVKIADPFMTKLVVNGVKTKQNASSFGKTHIDMEGSGLRSIKLNEKVKALSDEVSLAKWPLDRILTDAEITAMGNAKGLSQQHIADVINFHRATEEAMVNAMDRILVADEINITDVGTSLLLTTGANLNPNAALGITQQLTKLIKQQGSPDPLVRQQAQIALAGFQTVKGAPGVIKVISAGLVKLIEKTKALSNKPQFMPEFRSGQYQVVWKDGTKPGRAAFKTQQEALTYKQNLEAKGMTKVNIWDKFDEKTGSFGINPIMVQHEAAIQTAMYEAALQELGANHPALANIGQLIKYNPAEVAMHEFATQGLGQFFQKKKGALGAETIDFATNVVDYIERLGNGLAKRNVKAKVAIALQDEALKANPKLLTLAQQHFDNVVNPTGREWSLFKQLNFAYFMAFNPASMLMESSQGLMTLVPQLTRDTGSIAKSYEIWGNGVKIATETLMNKGQFKDPRLGRNVQRAVDEQRIDFGTSQELHIGEENLMPNLGNILKGGAGGMTPMDIAKKPIYWYLNGSRWLYGQATKANSAVAFIACFEHAIKTMPEEQAYNYATRTTDRTMYGGGAAARPVGMFNLLQGSKASGAMGAFYSLGTYTYSTIAMMARFGREGILRSGDIPASEKNAALKAFGQMMFTQVALGGALALPGATAAMALLEQLLPNLQVKQSVKDMTAQLFNDDQEMGGFVSDIALKGAPTRFLGVDLSSRIALSNILGVSGYDGFSLANLVGPSGAVFNALATGAKQVAQGDVSEGIKSLVPVPYKNMLDLYNNQGAIRDKAGNLIYDPTAKEKALYALGLRPTAVTNFREAQRNIERMEAIKTRENANFFNGLADRLQQGDIQGVKQELNYRQQQDPMFNAIAGGRRVVDAVEKRTFPIDLARTGSIGGASERQRIQGMLPDRGLPTEMQRLQFKMQLGQQLGLPQMSSRLQMNMAQMTDQIMSMNPSLSRQEAVRMVERLFGHQQKTL